MAKKSSQHPNLLFSYKMEKNLHENRALLHNSPAGTKIRDALDALNEYGTDPTAFSRDTLENLGKGWWSLRILQNGNYWRVMFRKVPNSEKYGLVLLFLKKDNKITQHIWKQARGVVKREGW